MKAVLIINFGLRCEVYFVVVVITSNFIMQSNGFPLAFENWLSVNDIQVLYLWLLTLTVYGISSAIVIFSLKATKVMISFM